MFFRTIFFVLIFMLTLVAKAVEPELPPLAVKAYLLKDVQSQRVIAAQKQDLQVEPASLTKLMTAYLTFEAIKNGTVDVNKSIKISEKAYQAEGSRMFLEPRKPVTIEALLYGLIVQSGNDAAIALAEQVAGTESAFAVQMNAKAQTLGMDHTHYMNATGLPDPKHYTTASDLMRLSEALIRDFPAPFKQYYATKTYTYNNIKQDNRNRLLWVDSHVDGLKTGHTKSAGYCLIATAMRDGIRHIAITMGAKSKADRASETQKLLNFGFQFFDTVVVYKQGDLIKDQNQQPKSLKVWKGNQAQLTVTVPEDLVVTVAKANVSKMSASITSIQPLLAPIQKGQKVGEVNVTLDGEILRTVPLVAAEEVLSAGFFGRIWDAVRLYFADWF